MKLSPSTLSIPRPQRGQLSLPLPDIACKKCQTPCDYCIPATGKQEPPKGA